MTGRGQVGNQEEQMGRQVGRKKRVDRQEGIPRLAGCVSTNNNLGMSGTPGFFYCLVDELTCRRCERQSG